MSNTVTVRMAQQMSGLRYDGREWPPYGGTIEVSAAEAAELCHTATGSSTPIAVPVVEERKTETADAPEDVTVEKREKLPTLPPRPSTAVPDADTPEEPKRGPGRPPKAK